MYSMYFTLSAASIDANAISAVFSSLLCNEMAAKLAQSDYSFTNRQSFIAFSHLFFSQKSNNILGYADIVKVIKPPSFLLRIT